MGGQQMKNEKIYSDLHTFINEMSEENAASLLEKLTDQKWFNDVKKHGASSAVLFKTRCRNCENNSNTLNHVEQRAEYVTGNFL